ncbi:MAG: transglycosylase SLT domain-containing protein [Bacteroidales bacterium]|nr:transglycosylase SLT domain-containing protein [Bacteroidales bacterium]
MNKVWKTKAMRVGVIVAMALLLVYVFLLSGLHSPGKDENTSVGVNSITGDTLYCTVITDKKLGPGTPALKFTYDLIRQFSQHQHCKVSVSVEKSSLRNWEDLADRLTDIIIFNSDNDTIPSAFKDYLVTSVPMEGSYVCAMRYDDRAIIDNVNFWITHIKPTPGYKKLYAKLHKTEKTGEIWNRPPSKDGISPYDALIKKYSETIGWDWRLLSALIYKESGFNSGIVSSMGAVGLMQVLQNIADAMGVENIYDPEQNIKAGCKILGKTHKKYLSQGMDEENALLFTLASYNAGEGRIQQCQKVAKAEGLNPNVWENVASVIPLMADGYDKNGVKVPPFRGGAQTMNYPARVMGQYEVYKNAVEE